MEARERLGDVLRTFNGVREVFPSSANFLLVRCVDAHQIYRQLLAAGVVVRDVSHHAVLTDCLRITVGSDDDHRRLSAALGLREEAA
jgi:histidinol-phosphate aminotransferase